MTIQSDIRKAIKAKHPNLKFKVRTVSFSDLAREDRIFVESDAWGMTKGNNTLYESVKRIAKPFGAVVMW